MKMRCDFKIQVNESLNQDEKVLILKYWEINPQTNKFNFRTQDIQKNTKKPIAELVSKNSHVFFLDLICPTCNVPHVFHSRIVLKSFEEYIGKICMKCITHEAQQRLEIAYEKFLVVNNKLNFDFSPQYDELTYLESVISLAIIEKFQEDSFVDVRGVNGRVNFLSSDLDIFITHDQIFNYEILQRLVSKNFLFYWGSDAQGLIGEYFNIYDQLTQDSVFASNDWRRKIHEARMSKPEAGLYFVVPVGLSVKKIKEMLMVNLNLPKLKHDDIKEIDFLVKKTLIAKALSTIPRLEKLNNITVQKDMALESIIEVGVLTFDMLKFVNILEYVARITSSDFNKVKYSQFYKNTIFHKNLHARLNYLIKNSRDQEFYTRVPLHIDYSLIEIFVNFYIFNESMGWDSISGKEIIKNWIFSYGESN